MGIRDTGAEQLIKDTAKHIFFSEGKLNATTQDIADAAGVTRTLLNYYFRSRDVLFEKVLEEAMLDMCLRMDEVLTSDLPFRKKIENFVQLFYTELTLYPYKETFMISEMNSQCCEIPVRGRSSALADFLKEVQTEMDNGTIRKMKPVNFMMNLLSLMAYPLLTRPLFKWLFELNEQQYEQLIEERKNMIIDILFQ